MRVGIVDKDCALTTRGLQLGQFKIFGVYGLPPAGNYWVVSDGSRYEVLWTVMEVVWFLITKSLCGVKTDG